MSILAAVASTNFTTSTTWALVDSTSYLAAETGSAVLTTAYSGAVSQTWTGDTATIDGIGVKLSVRTGTTGTISVHLEIATVEVAGTAVTINCSDLPAAATATADGGWVFFMFGAPVTLVGASIYSVAAKTSSASQVSLFRDATTANISRYLRTTTTQAPAAGDDLIITKEWTSAGTGTVRTVTMDNTATIAFGSSPTAANSLLTPGIAVSNGGTLKFADTSAANPYLRVSNSIIVYNGGELDIGTTVTQIPRDSTAVLELNPAADGDYGLLARNGSTLNIQGLSRSSGKNIVSCKLNADAPTTANLLTTGITGSMGLATTTNASLTASAGLDPTGTSLQSEAVTDNSTNGNHGTASAALGSVTNTTQVFSVWIAAGSGTNKRYVRMQLGNAIGTLTNGFYADIDLQAGTIGTCTAVGNGTATSSAIAAVGTGYLCTIIGKASSGAQSPVASLMACNSSGGISYAGDTTQNFLYYGPQIFTTSSLPSGTVTVDTDTGWLSGDVVAVASTSRTAADSELLGLNSTATATTLPCSKPLSGGGTIHSGTSPTQGEVILLTRNVKVRSTSASVMTYVFFQSGSAVNIDWAEFYYVGANIAGKHGVEIDINNTAAVNVDIAYSSIHDTKVIGLDLTVANAAATLTDLTVSNCVMWNLATTVGPGAQITVALTATNWTIDSNILIRTGNSGGWVLNDVGGTFTNNTVVGSNVTGLTLSEASATIGTISGNVIHSNGSSGLVFGSNGMAGTISTLVNWRNASFGIGLQSTLGSMTWDTFTLFGNTTSNISASTSSPATIQLKSPVLNGDTTFATTNGINLFNTGVGINFLIDDGDFSTVSGIKTAHSIDLNYGAIATDGRYTLRNTKLGAATEVGSVSNMTTSAFVSSEKHDQTAGLHKTWTRYGATTGGLVIDSVIYHTASPSLRCIPNDATNKLESATQFNGMKVAVASGATCTINVYVRKSIASDAGGVLYAGNQPRLIQKANPALGQNSDVVIATMTVANNSGTWELLTGSSSTASGDDGVWEFIVDSDGNNGAWINVDDWSTS